MEKIIKPILQEAKYRSLEKKREQINAVFYSVKTGCQWRNLPKDFPKWKNVYILSSILKINKIQKNQTSQKRGKLFKIIFMKRFYKVLSSLRKNLCKFSNCDKKQCCERLKKQPLEFFTVYNKYRNLSSFFISQSAGMERSGMESN